MSDEELPTEPTPELAPGSRGRQLVPLALSLCVLCAGIALAGIVHRVLLRSVDLFATIAEVERVERLTQALPAIVRRPGPIGVIVGASTLVRLDPVRMDEKLRESGVTLETYNLALDGALPSVDALVVRRLEAALPTPTSRLSVALLDLGLVVLTTAARRTADEDPFFYLAPADPAAIASLARTNPTRALDVAFRKYVIGEKYDADVSGYLDARVLDAPWHCRIQPASDSDAARAQAIKDYCALEDRVVPGGYVMGWNLASRGYDPPSPVALQPEYGKAQGFGTEPTDDEVRAQFERHMRKLARKQDLVDVHFDERSVAELEGVARELQRFTDHVVFFVSPEPPRMTRSAEAEARIAALLTRLGKTAPIIDMRRDPRFDNSDFVDAVHIKFLPAPARKYADAVADRLAPLLLAH